MSAPNFERWLKQTCTYWATTGVTDVFGKPVYAAPTTRTCRWEDKSVLFRDKLGQEKTSRSEIFLALSADIDGWLYLGTSAATDPTGVAGAAEIQQVDRYPDLRYLKQLYVVHL
jgi:hypothetical protein